MIKIMYIFCLKLQSHWIYQILLMVWNQWVHGWLDDCLKNIWNNFIGKMFSGHVLISSVPCLNIQLKLLKIILKIKEKIEKIHLHLWFHRWSILVFSNKNRANIKMCFLIKVIVFPFVFMLLQIFRDFDDCIV